MSVQWILLNEATAAKRRVALYVVDSTGLLPYTAGSGGTSRILYPGATALVAGATLVPVGTGTGHYLVTLTSADVNTLGPVRAVFPYASGTNLEAYADLMVVAVDPYDATAFGLGRLDAAVSSRSTLASGTFDANVVLFKGTAAVGTQGKANVGTADYVATGTLTYVGTAGTALGTVLATVTGTPAVNVTALKGTAVAGTQGTAQVNVVAVAGSSTAATQLARSAYSVLWAQTTGTLAATSFETDLTETSDDHYKGRVVVFVDGSLEGQASDVLAYTGTTKSLRVTTLTEAPGDSVHFIIV